jgi:UDP-N-acetyl-D-mannosaminuronate dehydrogenase
MHQTSVTAADVTRRIAARAARIGIIGRGYVGLPLAVEFARVGFTGTGFDTSLDRVAMLNAGRSHTPDVPDEALRRGIGDTRESPAVEVIARLTDRGAVVTSADPHVPQVAFEGRVLKAVEVTDERVAESDCVLILTDHSEFDYARIVTTSALVVDTRGATHTLAVPVDRVVAL